MIGKKIKNLAPKFLINSYHFLWALAGAVIFGFPGKRTKVIGVTGTNGKTTTIELMSKILEQAGYKVAVLSSIKFQVGGEQEENKLRMTMPGRARAQKFLKQAADAKCDYAILEITSEGIVQHRHRFIDFEAAILTNLSPEHIESHGSFENYRDAKLKFFNDVKKIHILNLDDENFKYFNQFNPVKKYFYGFGKVGRGPSSTNFGLGKVGRGPSSTNFAVAENIRVLSSGIKFLVKDQEFNLNLLGEFNIYNALAAICVGLSQDIDLQICKKALEEVQGVAGRMEMVVKEPFKVFVDYAFTPNALEQVYKTIKNNWAERKMICVLGACGGGRDKWKRPVLGELAGKYCQRVVVTNEDPYDEDPSQILSEIKFGIPDDKIQITNVILDRREAIRKALAMAEPGDAVIITGKGCESSICLAGGEKMPWDDRQAVREEFQKIKQKYPFFYGRRKKGIIFMQAKKFEVLEHTADLKIRAFGRDKKQVFENLMLGMQKSLRPKIANKQTKTKIGIKAEDLESLLVDFLSEINYLNEVNNEIYQKIIFDKFSDTELEAELFGKKAARFGLQIKGVTFHDLDIRKTADGAWEATVLFDI